MDVNAARQYFAQIRDLSILGLEALVPDLPATPIYKTPAELDAAIAAASSGAILRLDPTLVYPSPLTLNKTVALRSADVRQERMTRDQPAPRFERGITVTGDGVTLLGLDVRNVTTSAPCINLRGANPTVDRVRVLGDPVKGQRRGIAANSNGNAAIIGSYIDDCFVPYPGDDAQAICAWDMSPGLLIEDCFLSAGTEVILIGGGDPASAARDPSVVIIRHCTITKNPAWMSLPIGVKNAVELKNCRHFTIEGNDISYAWAGRGQEGFLLVLTVRNQDGRNPTATIQDGVILGNTFHHGAAAINILAKDTIKETSATKPTPVGEVRPSERMARVTINGNAFVDMDPLVYQTKPDAASRKMIQIQQGPIELHMTNNQFESKNHTSTIYFASGPPMVDFAWTGNTYPKTRYGMFGANVQPNAAFDTYVASGVTSPNTEVPA